MSEVIRIRGAVQGVGFRPTVARLARAQGLDGFVRNDADGVLIGLAVDEAACARFLDDLMQALPPLARVESVERQSAEVVAEGFVIEASEGGAPRTEIAPDAATCQACMEEVLDPYQRRFRYPFTTCTHCGPRYSIVTAIPYDRANTTMAGFEMCDDCGGEYGDEGDRRYHAQPLACHVCGPKARLERMDGRAFSVSRWSMHDEVDAAGGLIKSGEIVAIKGLGGYQLCCDATKPEAVQKLRDRKHRPHKAFALMVRDLEIAERFVILSEAERALLKSPQAPVVLCERRPEVDAPWTVADEVAPDQRRLGVMLPTTPLHRLILHRVKRPVVCTSGNVTDEPQQIDDEQMKEKLGGIADWVLLHDRPIRNRVDDSVVATLAGEPRVLRRARGYAPGPIALPQGFEEAPAIAALGGELKGCFALVSDGQAVLSPHLGDLDHPAAFAAYQDTFALMSELYAHQPEVVAYDAHRGYRTHEMGRGLARARALESEEVLHHHAHIASCLAENGWARDAGAVLGLALDGLGMGEGGALWGGELLLCDYLQAERVGTLKPVALLGGDKAAKQPWRNLYAHLRAEMSWAQLETNHADCEALAFLQAKPVDILEQILGDQALAPKSSSTGRLFDAVAAALGLAREEIGYEGQAAMMLEALVTDEALAEAMKEPYPFAIPRQQDTDLPYVEPLGMWNALLGDVWAGTEPALISARFHVGFARGLARLIALASERTGRRTVALSGGCFANRILLETLVDELRAGDLSVLLQRRVPSNDGGLALGQAAIAAARWLQRKER